MSRSCDSFPSWAIRCRLIFLTLAMGLAAGNGGCWLPYAISVGVGELNVLLGSRPIDEVLAWGDLDEVTESQLRYVLDVRGWAVDALGLNAGDSYTTYYDSEGDNVLYNVSASPKDRLEPYVWTFPIVGGFEYIGFFSEDQARAYAESFIEDGYDVLLYPPAGYSTIGWFTDPLFSAALSRDTIDLTDLVIHELTHNTAYKPSHSVLNESLATFVGRTGTLQYLSERFGADSELLQIARERWTDADLYNQFWFELYDALEAFYNRDDLTSEEKIAQREEIFDAYKQRFVDEYLPEFHAPQRYAGLTDIEIDNAYVLINRRYNLDLDLFQAVYDALGQDLAAAVQVFKASIPADDPKQYLRDWLAARP